MAKVLITGAAGRVGRFLCPGLAEYGWEVRGLDLLPGGDAPDWVAGDIRDPAALDAAFDGVDAVVHLAGIPVEAPFADIVSANVEGTHAVLEAARRAGVRRFVYASSNHAVGAVRRDGVLPADVVPRPDGFYGLSKAFGEELCGIYAAKEGMEVVALRIGACFPEPFTVRMLSVWLSPADACRLVHAALTAPGVRFEVVYGVSANTRGWWDLEPARRLGYEPRDDAEAHAARVLAEHGGDLAADDPERIYVGGSWATDPLPHRGPEGPREGGAGE